MDLFISFALSNQTNLIALIWFFVCFKGYNSYTFRRSRTCYCLSSLMHLYRLEWMNKLLERDNRIGDMAVIANLERGVAFFASSSMLILAGLMTALGATEKVIDITKDMPFAMQATKAEWEMKLLLLIGLFVYAFFKFTWSLRQYGFTSVMVGAAPLAKDNANQQELVASANRLAAMSSMAANNSNLGLRTFYFSMAVLGWFINTWLFMLLTTGVVFILYRREFKSATLRQLVISKTV